MNHKLTPAEEAAADALRRELQQRVSRPLTPAEQQQSDHAQREREIEQARRREQRYRNTVKLTDAQAATLRAALRMGSTDDALRRELIQIFRKPCEVSVYRKPINPRS